MKSREKILKILLLRDKYIFDEHQDYCHISKYLIKKELGEKWIDWNGERAELLPPLKGREL